MSGWPLGLWLRQWLLWQQGLLLNFWFVFVVIIKILNTIIDIINFIIVIVVFTTIIIKSVINTTYIFFPKVSANAAGGGLLASDAFLR